MALSAGQKLGPYEILSSLGAGGMGEVYRARDTRLGREVAVKVLATRLSSESESLERFEREARSLASLSHPHILVIHDFGNDNGITYVVTELLKGETLRARINRSPISWNQVCTYGIALAEGLAAAHSSAIIHRDLKPENIFLTSENGIKILDFGLARLDKKQNSGESWMQTSPDTAPGVTMGTVGYMSPEQIRGLDVDARTDIFSFGCVLHEMCTGKAPFARGTAADTISAILKEDPPELTKSGMEIPPEVDRIILHCLEKDPEKRFQSTRDIAFDLKEVSSGVRSSGKTIPVWTSPKRSRYVIAALVVALLLSIIGVFIFRQIKPALPDDGKPMPIAVADFANETGEKELNGLSGMFITSLEQSKRLSVLTRSRMFDILKQIGKENVQLIDESLGREICKRTGISALVTATVRKFGTLYTIDLKVLDPSGDAYLFTAKEEGKGLESVPAMLDRLSDSIRADLNEKASEIAQSSHKVSQATTENLEAYQHYFQGEEFINHLKFREALRELRKATELDPTFAMAHYRLAYAESWQLNERAVEPMRKAMQNISRVPKKEQLLFRALFAHLERNDRESIQLYKQIAETYPDEKEALWMVGDLSYHTADYPQAALYMEKVVKMDPTFERGWQHLDWTYDALKDLDRKFENARKYYSSIKSPSSYEYLARMYSNKEQYEEARDLGQKLAQHFPEEESGGLSIIANTYIIQGDYEKAEATLKELISPEKSPRLRRNGFGELANLYTYQGRIRDAIKMVDELKQLDVELNDNADLFFLYVDYAGGILDYYNDPAEAKKSIARAMQYEEHASSDALYPLVFAYLQMGALPEAKELAKRMEANNPFVLDTVQAFQHISRKEYEQAVPLLENVSGRTGGWQLGQFCKLHLSRVFVTLERYDEALNILKEMQKQKGSYSRYPLLYLESARVARLKGDRTLEKSDLRILLDCWKNADSDLPDFREAKARFAELQ